MNRENEGYEFVMEKHINSDAEMIESMIDFICKKKRECQVDVGALRALRELRDRIK